MDDWIIYQIGGPDRDKFRFIVTAGFQDAVVERHLREGEFIDTTTTLLGEFGGDVTVLSAEAPSARFVKRDYWNMAGTHRPYRNWWHDFNDEAVDEDRELDKLLAHVEDGEAFEVSVRATGERPFGERRYRLQRAHEYEPETDEQMAERLGAQTSLADSPE